MSAEDWNKIIAAVRAARQYGGTIDADVLMRELSVYAQTAAEHEETARKDPRWGTERHHR